MGFNFTTQQYVDGTTNLNATDLNKPTNDLDWAIGKNAGHHAFITSSGPISVRPIGDGDEVAYPEMYVWFHRESDGAIIMNKIPAAAHTMTNTTTNVDANVVYATLSETDAANVTGVTLSSNTQGSGDYDLLPTLFKDRTKIVIAIRTRMPSTSQRGMVFFPMLAYHQPLRGEDNLGTGTTKTVTFPSSINLQRTDFHVVLTPRSAGFWAKDPYISSRTATTFVITLNANGASENFSWAIIP